MSEKIVSFVLNFEELFSKAWLFVVFAYLCPQISG